MQYPNRRSMTFFDKGKMCDKEMPVSFVLQI